MWLLTEGVLAVNWSTASTEADFNLQLTVQNRLKSYAVVKFVKSYAVNVEV